MNKYLEKAKILSKFFGVYAIGNFDLTLEELANIIKMLETDKELETNLKDLYERIYKTRVG